jgi:hypothetical protein
MSVLPFFLGFECDIILYLQLLIYCPWINTNNFWITLF